MLGFYYSETSKRSLDTLKNLKILLAENKIEYCDLTNCDFSATAKNIDLLVVFGGDGSVLRASKILFGVPIVAINTGNLGFLTSYEESSVNDFVNDYINGNLVFSRREFMSVRVADREYFALNDGVILKNYSKDNACECVKLSLDIDDQFVDNYVSDGLILSTPTGSTAYAISAGGPIMAPDLNAYVAAPICAHSLHSRPIVFSANSVAVVKVGEKSKDCALYIDGCFKENLAPNSVVTVKQSDKFVKICDNTGKFYSKLSKKLTKWSTKDF